MKIEIELSEFQLNVLCAACGLGNAPTSEAVAGAFDEIVMMSGEVMNLFEHTGDEYGVEYSADEEVEG